MTAAPDRDLAGAPSADRHEAPPERGTADVESDRELARQRGLLEKQVGDDPGCTDLDYRISSALAHRHVNQTRFRAQRSAEAWPSFKTLAAECHVLVSSAHRSMHRLIARGHWRVVRRGGGRSLSNRYAWVIFPRDEAGRILWPENVRPGETFSSGPSRNVRPGESKLSPAGETTLTKNSIEDDDSRVIDFDGPPIPKTRSAKPRHPQQSLPFCQPVVLKRVEELAARPAAERERDELRRLLAEAAGDAIKAKLLEDVSMIEDLLREGCLLGFHIIPAIERASRRWRVGHGPRTIKSWNFFHGDILDRRDRPPNHQDQDEEQGTRHAKPERRAAAGGQSLARHIASTALDELRSEAADEI